jgi:hypothetical protein
VNVVIFDRIGPYPWKVATLTAEGHYCVVAWCKDRDEAEADVERHPPVQP